MTLKRDAKFDEELMVTKLVVTKVTWGIWWITMRAVASLKICTLLCYFCWKYIMFESKRCRGIMCHSTEEWCKIWRGTDMCFEKWHGEFGELHRNTQKSSSLPFFFCPRYMMFELKIYGVMSHYTEGLCNI